MKKLFLLFFITISLPTFAQDHDCGAVCDPSVPMFNVDFVFNAYVPGSLMRNVFQIRDTSKTEINTEQIFLKGIKSSYWGVRPNSILHTNSNGKVLASSIDSLFIKWSQITNVPTFLTTFTETDPLVGSHIKAITTGNIATWTQAFNWGNHATAGYITATSTTSLTNKSGLITQWTNNAGYLTSEVDGSTTNEIQTLSLNVSTLTLSNGGGSIVLPSAPGVTTFTGFGFGTAYSLTTTSAKVDFTGGGSTDPTITITEPGTYLIYTNLKTDFVGLTTLLQTCNFKLRRTNNTATDIPRATSNISVSPVTLLTATGPDSDLPVIIYTTTNSNDVIELWGNRQGITAGSINISEASITAVRIY